VLGQLRPRDYKEVIPFGVLPWTHGYKLVSLWKMLAIYARIFVTAIEELQNVRYGLVLGQMDDKTPDKPLDKVLKQEVATRLKEILDWLSKWCGTVDLNATKHLVDDLLSHAKTGVNTDEVDAKIDSLQSMLKNELQERKFLYVPKDRVGYYNNKSICSPLVADKFPRAIPDIIEAGNCYALERPTACVFHLMRVIPYGMEILAKKLKVKYGASIETLQWGDIIPPIDKAVKLLQQHMRSKKRAADQKYYSEVVSHLYFCKDAWRNHVSHGREPYDMPRAKSVLDHVGHVMNLLAQKMK
jgi:hypothetical protein